MTGSTSVSTFSRQAKRIELEEWTPAEVDLTPDQLAELQGIKEARLTIEPFGQPGRYSVKPESTVGAATGRSLDLVIRPKVPVDRVFYLLGYSRRVPPLRDVASLDAAEPLVEGFVAVFLNFLRHVLRRGLLMGYRSIDETLQGVRGRVRIADQLRRRFALPLPVEVSYDEYALDITENRIVKAALRRLEVLRLRSRELPSRIAEALTGFDGVTDVAYTPSRLPVVRYTRLNSHYRPLIELSSLILRHSSVELQAGRTVMSGLFFDMNDVFEDFVFQSLRDHLSPWMRPGQRWVQGRSLRLDEDGYLRPEPDLAWWDGERCIFVGDAKYKETAAGESSDLYQLLAYCAAAGVERGMLVYAALASERAEHRVVHSGPTLHLESLDITSPLPELHANCDRIAQRVRELCSAEIASSAGLTPVESAASG